MLRSFQDAWLSQGVLRANLFFSALDSLDPPLELQEVLFYAGRPAATDNFLWLGTGALT